MFTPTIVLASASPRRAELLRHAGFEVVVRPTGVDEDAITAAAGQTLLDTDSAVVALTLGFPKANRVHAVTALARARAKADAARVDAAAADVDTPARYTPAAQECTLTLSADTTVVCAGQFLDKPRDAAEARQMLRLLSNRTHHVYTALVMEAAVNGRSPAAAPLHQEAIVETGVNFAALDEDLLEWYIDSQEWRGVAGGYRIQERAGRFIPTINGSYSNVVGLPIEAVWAMVRRFPCGIISSGLTEK